MLSTSPTSNSNTDLLCQQYLNILYQHSTGHGVNARQLENISEAYGEILYQGIDSLLAAMSLTEHDVFYDLGSGLGKAVMQVFLKSPVKEACGIEIIPELYQQSLLAAQKAQQELPAFYLNGRTVTFQLGSFLDISLSSATVLLIGSPCFTQNLLLELGKIVENNPRIHTVLTLRPIHSLRRLPFIKTVRVECSWDTALCYLYSSSVR